MNWIKAPLVGLLCLLLSACSKPSNPTIKLAINPWPGYQYLYLAKEKGLFKQAGLNIEIVEAPSLAEVKRFFHQGKVNAMTSTMVEAVMLATKQKTQISIVLVTDYSNGGDQILARPTIDELKQLKNQRIGVELGALGAFFLHQALAQQGMALEDIKMLNIEQLDASDAFSKDLIDAYVTYPPYSNLLVNNHNLHSIFNSSQIPRTVLDVVTISTDLVKQDPTLITRLHSAWQAALNYAKKHPIEANNIMAKREGISADEFTAELAGIKVLSAAEQKTDLTLKSVSYNMEQVCSVLNKINSISFDCTQLPNYLSVGIKRE